MLALVAAAVLSFEAVLSLVLAAVLALVFALIECESMLLVEVTPL